MAVCFTNGKGVAQKRGKNSAKNKVFWDIRKQTKT